MAPWTAWGHSCASMLKQKIEKCNGEINRLKMIIHEQNEILFINGLITINKARENIRSE